jgi:hypothetical protein
VYYAEQWYSFDWVTLVGAGNGCNKVKTEFGNYHVLVKTDRGWK